MKLAKYWSRQTAPADLQGEPITVGCWRGSMESPEAAARLAKAAAQALAKRITEQGGFVPDSGPARDYGYPDKALREELLEEFPDATGALAAAITRNAVGARVLNTERAMFVDLDLGPLGLIDRIKAMFKLSPDTPEAAALVKVATWLAAHPGWGFRVYRTPAGLRLLATHAPQDPCAPETRRVLQDLHCDPLFIQLCGVQESFRARLDPKPFRVGLKTAPPPFPRTSLDAERAFEAWLKDYRDRCEGRAACAFLAHLGNTSVHPDLAKIVKLHDERSRALESGLRLG
ncbi:MAG: hypothetical protein U0P81_11620 [Holophagaceae bacterium]